ncbi:cysteine methyltransferase [Candidatus Peregrinibacteria bacterium CG22_combo_CG10-13_8_21_14_all_49_11]|nr:MAG: cysteine methyltransferase [Candidatus Peregrinibacteria bacterium CG22_combo_CG10-13_8_21_14_all_49_11]
MVDKWGTVSIVGFPLISPIGSLLIEATDEHIVSVRFSEDTYIDPSSLHFSSCFTEEIHSYFCGTLKQFSRFPLFLQGTPFQRSVWAAVQRIPHGKTATYKEIAEVIGHPKAVRAVGSAVGKNPFALLIPCHRVVPSGNRGYGMYAWGKWRKEWLLGHEISQE